MSQADWENFYNDWFKRMEKCIVHTNTYFVKQKSDFYKVMNTF